MDQELEQPRARLTHYGPTILGFLVVVALVAGGWFLWQRIQQRRAEQQIAQQETATPTPSPSTSKFAVTPTPPSATELPGTGIPTSILGTLAFALVGSLFLARRLSK